MSKKSQRTKMLERAARVALSNCIATHKKLAASVEADGGVFIPHFLTAEHHRKIVREMRADHAAELAEMVTMFAMASGAKSHHDCYPQLTEAHEWGARMWPFVSAPKEN
jgi:hypothetical protein